MRANHFSITFTCMWINNIACPSLHGNGTETREVSMVAKGRIPTVRCITSYFRIQAGVGKKCGWKEGREGEGFNKM